MKSIESSIFNNLIYMTPKPDFKYAPLFDVEYFTKPYKIRDNMNTFIRQKRRNTIATYTRPSQRGKFE